MESLQRQARRKRQYLAFALFVAMALFFACNFHLAIVRGISMEPTLHNGQLVLVSRAYWLTGPPAEGDVVVLRQDGETLVKRIDHFETNGVYVLGDNRRVSEDSRYFGPVPMSRIVGKVMNAGNVKYPYAALVRGR